MPDRGVVDDEIDDDPDAALLGVVHELDELAERPVLGVDAVEVGDVVAVVPVGRRIERLKPEAGDAEPGEVVEPARQPREVADAVAIRVEVLLDVEAVENRIFVPEVVDLHGREGATRVPVRTSTCRATL
jgi:hypothetical protein